MEVKPGYKQTEVGPVPENWDVSTIDRVFSFKQGVQTPIEQQSTVEREGYKRFIRIIDLTNPQEDWRYIADPGATHHVVKTDLFMVRYGSPGLMGFGHEGVIANNLFRLIPKKKVDSHFYYQYLANKQGEIAGLSGSSTMPAVSFSTLSLLYIVYPPISEQRAIARALSDVDSLLGALDQLIAKKRDLKQAAMQQLLTGQKRLPGFQGEWEVKRLGDVVEIKKGELITEKDAIHGNIPVIAGGKKPSYLHNRANRSGKTITISGSGASAGYVSFFETPIFASDCSTISEGPSYAIQFIYFVLHLRQEEIYAAQTGGAQPHIHPNDLRPMTIRVPQVAEQTAIAATLSDMDAELATLEQRRDKIRALKQGMMQELLTGRTRLV